MSKRGRLHNHSPWIHQLKTFRKRPVKKLSQDHEADVIIIGAGIAGTISAFYALTRTKHKVIVLDAREVAHGATGHNAGQVAPYFERPFSDIVEEYGLKLASNAQRDVLSAWDLLDEIREFACLETPLSTFVGYAGCSSIEQLCAHLENRRLRLKGGIDLERVYVSDEVNLRKIPSKYRGLFEVVPHANILNMLETNDTRFVAALSTKKGVMNSALFCEEIMGFLLEKYSKRFRLAEHTPVRRITLFKRNVLLETPQFKVSGKKVVLCTNGFENVEIVNTTGSEVDSKFHENIHGLVGFMAGYVEHTPKMPTAISYFKRKTQTSSQAYFYFTRRFFELEKGTHHTLVCAGGPELPLAKKSSYKKHGAYGLDDDIKKLDRFFKSTYAGAPAGKIKYKYHWHGLMGYTKTGLRIIGPEPCNSNLIYNIGCNGVGIMSSVFAGFKVSKILNGQRLGKSLFDPQDLRCVPRRKQVPNKYHKSLRF